MKREIIWICIGFLCLLALGLIWDEMSAKKRAGEQLVRNQAMETYLAASPEKVLMQSARV